MISASLAERMAEFIEAVRDARTLVRALDDKPINNQNLTLLERPPPMARDAGMAALAGFATAVGRHSLLCRLDSARLAGGLGNGRLCRPHHLFLCRAGRSGSHYPPLSFCDACDVSDSSNLHVRRATLHRRLWMLSVALAPALIGIGYIQADPARSGAALPMFSCLIVGLGFVATFQPDFAEFVNTGIAQVMGIVITIAVTRLFRSVGVIWSARRMIRAQWRELEALATARGEPDFGGWTALALDRTGQIAARLAFASEGDELHAADELGDLRVGRNILHLRRAAEVARGTAAEAINKLLSEVANLFRIRHRDGIAIPAGTSVLTALDGAMTAIQTMDNDALRHQALLATVGMRCNLFPAQAGPGMAAAA